MTLDNEDDTLLPDEVANEEAHKLVVHEERLRVWPPWPWPPWGDDDDGDKDTPKENRTERAHRLAKAIIELEKQIANASLDL